MSTYSFISSYTRYKSLHKRYAAPRCCPRPKMREIVENAPIHFCATTASRRERAAANILIAQKQPRQPNRLFARNGVRNRCRRRRRVVAIDNPRTELQLESSDWNKKRWMHFSRALSTRKAILRLRPRLEFVSLTPSSALGPYLSTSTSCVNAISITKHSRALEGTASAGAR